MDNTQLGFLVASIVAVNGSFSALLVAFVNRQGNRKAKSDPWDGRERRGDGNGYIAQHIVSCPHVETFTAGINRIETRLGAIENILMGK